VVSNPANADQLRAEHVQEIRWWTRDEIRASDATFSPRALRTLLEDLLSGPVPDEPLRITGF